MGQSRPLDRVQVPLLPATTMQCASALVALLLATPNQRVLLLHHPLGAGRCPDAARGASKDRDQDFRKASGLRMHRVASSPRGLPISIAMACKLCVLHALR
jgi:hypothetical protein